MVLTAEQKLRLNELLLKLFKNWKELQRTLGLRKGIRLENISPEADLLEQGIYEVIEWAEREDRLSDLLEAMQAAKSGSQKLRALVEEIRANPEPVRRPERPIISGLEKAGIITFTDNFHKGIDWEPLFTNTKELDIFFSYGRTWRNTHRDELTTLVTTSNIQLRVVLPDRDREDVIASLSYRFRYTPDELKVYIRDAIIYFQELLAKAEKAKSGATISIWLISTPPLYSFYRFDKAAVIAWFGHRREQVPVFFCAGRI
jgi:hypothetical protein